MEEHCDRHGWSFLLTHLIFTYLQQKSLKKKKQKVLNTKNYFDDVLLLFNRGLEANQQHVQGH